MSSEQFWTNAMNSLATYKREVDAEEVLEDTDRKALFRERDALLVDQERLKAEVEALKKKLEGITPANNRKLSPGTYRPVPLRDTGYIGDKSSLRKIEGNFAFKQEDEILENAWITGAYNRNGIVGKMRNCLIEGGTFVEGKQYTLAKMYEKTVKISEFEDCTFRFPLKSSWAASVAQGGSFVMYRCDLDGCVDGLGAQNGNVGLYASHVYNQTWVYPDLAMPSHTTGTHPDAIQVHGGGKYYNFVGNLIEMAAKTNAAFMLNNGNGTVDYLTIAKNWLWSLATGDMACASCINVGVGTFGHLVLQDNVLSLPNTWKTGPIWIKPEVLDKQSPLISGNVYSDGTAVPIRRG